MHRTISPNSSRTASHTPSEAESKSPTGSDVEGSFIKIDMSSSYQPDTTKDNALPRSPRNIRRASSTSSVESSGIYDEQTASRHTGHTGAFYVNNSDNDIPQLNIDNDTVYDPTLLIKWYKKKHYNVNIADRLKNKFGNDHQVFWNSLVSEYETALLNRRMENEQGCTLPSRSSPSRTTSTSYINSSQATPNPLGSSNIYLTTSRHVLFPPNDNSNSSIVNIQNNTMYEPQQLINYFRKKDITIDRAYVHNHFKNDAQECFDWMVKTYENDLVERLMPKLDLQNKLERRINYTNVLLLTMGAAAIYTFINNIYDIKGYLEMQTFKAVLWDDLLTSLVISFKKFLKEWIVLLKGVITILVIVMLCDSRLFYYHLSNKAKQQ